MTEEVGGLERGLESVVESESESESREIAVLEDKPVGFGLGRLAEPALSFVGGAEKAYFGVVGFSVTWPDFMRLRM